MTTAREARLYHRLQVAAHKLQTSADRAIGSAVPLTTAQAAVLTIVQLHGTASQKRVAEELHLHESAMTKMVRRLLAAGYIERSEGEGDRRVRLLTVTPSGQRALSRVQARFARINTRIDEALTATDRKVLAKALDKLITVFDSED